MNELKLSLEGNVFKKPTTRSRKKTNMVQKDKQGWQNPMAADIKQT